MNRYYYEQEERPVSRSEKIREALQMYGGEQPDFEGGRNHYGIIRMVTAGVLFFVLILSFHLKLSYQGFDRAYVEQVLSEDGHLEGIVKQAAEVMKQVVPAK